MRLILSPGILSLILGYTMSQFYRAFLAVLTPTLSAEIGAGPADLALSSGLWYISFAAMQLPVGWALDKFGPRLTVSTLLALGGGGGAALFSLATAPWHLHVAMVMLGIGCAPVMVGSYFIFARTLPATAMSTAGGAVVGIGSLGNMLGPRRWSG
ncbi:MFS transporter [Paracoccus cavernae]|uniref:MFS transporter n=1 Tax=Paracoccus cavernae TaxID=1571207 RepID=A0ABT8D7Q8_9RHOB|nr:MFS transporter [Paracoccus cavernae]